MNKYFLAAAAATFLVAACIPSNNDDVVGSASAAVAPASGTIVKAKPPKSDTAEIPSEIHFPSSVGEVIFHHQIDAKQLITPHPDYLKSSWINCKVCHDDSGKIKQKLYACSDCHSTNPTNIADETLSPKVVIHKQCWKCHQVSTGKEASKSCEKCHSGKKTL